MRNLLTALLLSVSTNVYSGDWLQFRGPNASGVPENDAPLPDEIGTDKNVVWKVAIPPGHSSPIVVGDRIYLTADRDAKLLTLGLDRATGKLLWEREAPYKKPEAVHSTGSLVQPTPCSDGAMVVSFIGSFGLLAYDHNGKELWHHELGPYKNDFGTGSSPIIVDDRVVLVQDHDLDAHIAAYDKQSGKELWKTPRPDAHRNYCTPVVWNVNGRKQVVVAGTLRISGYDFETGAELWHVSGISRMVCMTPIVAKNRLFAAGWSAGGDEGERTVIVPYDKVVAESDTNQDGAFTEEELPEGAVKKRFTQADRNKDGLVTKGEYEHFRGLFDLSQNALIAIAANDQGVEPKLTWQMTKHIPFCASPILYRDLIFCCKDGGVVTSLDAATGKPYKSARTPGTGDYYSSPAAGDGKVFFTNQEGKVTIVSTERDWKVVSTADLGETIYASPAIADGKLYIRTAGHLYCFGKQ